MEVNLLTRWASINHDMVKYAQGMSTPPRSTHPHVETISTIRRFLKGFGVGSIGKFAITLLPILLKGNRGLRAVLRQNKKLVTDPIRYGLFLGGFQALFEAVIRKLRRSSKPFLRKYRAALSGVIASIALLVLPKSVQVTVSLFISVRAMEIAVRSLHFDQLVPTIPHVDVLVMIAASQEILSTFFYNPEFLDPSYLHFLTQQGGKDPVVMTQYAALLNTTSLREASRLAPIDTSVSLQAALCKFFHPEVDCTGHFLSYVRMSSLKAIALYLPVYLAPLLLFRSTSLVEAPLPTIAKLLSNVAQSSAFLTTYIAVASSICCALNHSKLLVGHGSLITRMYGLCGLALLFEKPHRRIELALYVLTHALRSFCNRMVSLGFPRVPGFHLWMFTASTGVMMSAFIESPWLMRPSYVKLLGFMFGSSSERIKAPPQDEGSECEDDELTLLSLP